MDTLSAFAMGEASRGREGRVFDWDTAARILREQKVTHARAGLQSDMEWTSGQILYDGVIVPRDQTYTYLASNWAIPVLDVDGEEIPCFIMKSEADVRGWDSDTYWPDSAIAIFEGRS